MIIALSFGVCCLTPCLFWFKFVWLPNKQDREFRKEMHRKRRERVDEAARVIKETLRLAKEEDARRAKAAQVKYYCMMIVRSDYYSDLVNIGNGRGG